MTNIVLIKRSSTANSVPTAGDLQPGELAINYTDGNLFFKNAGNSVQLITSQKLVSVTGNITGGNVLTAGLISATGNITGGNILTVGLVSATGNITAGNVLGGANVNATSLTGTTLSVTGNITGGNVLGGANVNATTHTGATVSVTGNITAGNILGGANVNATTHTGTTVSVSANITGGNVLTGGLISATGNVIAGGGIVPRVVSIADATSVTINAATTDLATQTNTQAAGTLTINAPTGTVASGQKFIFRLQSSNIQTFSWNAVFVGSTDLSLPTVSSGSSKYDYMGFIYNSTAAEWQILAKNFGF